MPFRPRRTSYRHRCICWLMIALIAGFTPVAQAESVSLKNGVQVVGSGGSTSKLGELPQQLNARPVVFVDDGLRRTYFHRSLVESIAPLNPVVERIPIEQRPAPNSRQIKGVSQILKIQPFNEYGRRMITLAHASGPITIYQGITEVTPNYCVVEGLAAGDTRLQWQSRIDTHSVPRDVLSKILRRQIDPTNPEARLRIATLYIQAERYKDAATELEGILKDFPDLQLQRQVDELRQAHARSIVKEIKLMRESGQVQRAFHLADRFPTKDIAGTILADVRDLKQLYETDQQHVRAILESIGENLTLTLEQASLDEPQQKLLADFHKEIKNNLSSHNLTRMADFFRLRDDSSQTAEQKLSLAISGWLLGNGAAVDNLAVSLSLIEVRKHVREYLTTDNPLRRKTILEQLDRMEGTTPDFLSKLIAHLTPLSPPPVEQDPPVPGMFTLKVPGLVDGEEITYVVQLPPEYNPYRRYPCVVSLHGTGTTPQQQLDWWAGSFSPRHKSRVGQASRHGYIVVAPQWTQGKQLTYKYSAREHAAVLFSLRDALKRFAIDTDRVFLSGHADGGDAAWDIGLAHPDLWAGVIPISARGTRYVEHYWENAKRNLGFYFVNGQFDHARMEGNQKEWNRHLTANGFDTMLVVYRGRGQEHFREEIHRIFDWMNSHRRKQVVDKFNCSSMRPWDNFFWWIELEGLPTQSMIPPAADWPKHPRPARIEAKVIKQNHLSLSVKIAERTTVWLSPELIDFSQKITIQSAGRKKSRVVQPDREVLLEDVRTRGDRQHPFWAKIILAKGAWR